MIAQPWLDIGTQLWESRGWLPFSLAWYAECAWPGERASRRQMLASSHHPECCEGVSQFSTHSFPACCVPRGGPREKANSSAPVGEGNPKNPHSLWYKEPLGMRHVGNASPAAGPEKFASDACLEALHGRHCLFGRTGQETLRFPSLSLGWGGLAAGKD